MSGYGLLSRHLVLNVRYQDSPTTFADAKVPVFAVGRDQLCRMFGLNGYPKCRIGNVTLDLSYSDFEHANYALMCLGRWPYTDRFSMVAIYDVYETFEQADLHVGLAMELDCENGYPVHYDYEIWQICNDGELWNKWMLSICVEHIQRRGFEMRERDSKQSHAMSEDYLSSLKTAKVSQGHECCATCGDILSKPYRYCIDGLLVCRDCCLEYVNDLDARDADRPKYEIKEEGFVYVEGMGYC